MSISDIILDKNLSNQGIFDAQLYSLQVYKTPTLPTDVITLQHSASAGFNVLFPDDIQVPQPVSITIPGIYVCTGSIDPLGNVFILPHITESMNGQNFIFILRDNPFYPTLTIDASPTLPQDLIYYNNAAPILSLVLGAYGQVSLRAVYCPDPATQGTSFWFSA
jgi:hypothetical protein